MQNTRVPGEINSPASASASDTVYRSLKDEILSGEIESGALLTESTLAKRFSVSRTPVREALGQLASDGLITTIPRRGHVVRTIPLSEILEAFRVRELLEVEAAGLAASRITAAELARLKAFLERWDEDEGSTESPSEHYEFHMAIARASGNQVLVDFIGRLLMLMQRIIVMDPRFAQPDVEQPGDNESIVEALEARDVAAARAAMTDHVRVALAFVLRNAGLDYAIPPLVRADVGDQPSEEVD